MVAVVEINGLARLASASSQLILVTIAISPDQSQRASLRIICMRHTIASRCSKLCFCAIPSDKNHLCNGSLQQSKDVILRGNQNSEYLERMHFVFIIRISI